MSIVKLPESAGCEVWYRVVDRTVGHGYDERTERCAWYSYEMQVLECSVVRRTKCGAWIAVVGGKRFVNLSTTKKYAHPTLEDALESYVRRKSSQIRVLRNQLHAAERFLETAENVGAIEKLRKRLTCQPASD